MKTKIEVIPLEIPKLRLLLDMIQAKLGEDVAQPFRQLLDSHIQLLDLIQPADLDTEAATAPVRCQDGTHQQRDRGRQRVVSR